MFKLKTVVKGSIFLRDFMNCSFKPDESGPDLQLDPEKGWVWPVASRTDYKHMHKWKTFLEFLAHSSYGGRVKMMSGRIAGICRAGQLCDFEMDSTLRQN